MGFLYYFPGQTSFSAPHAESLGLGCVFDGPAPSWAGVQHGPDGKPGVMVAHREADLFAKNVDWREQRGFFLGTVSADLPGPQELARESLVPGYSVELGDGRRWDIPVARPGAPGYGLPQVVRLNAAGERARFALPRYAAIERVAESAFRGLCHQLGYSEAPEAVSEEFLWEGSCAALGINYRVSQWEVSRLGLLTTTNMPAVLAALCDWPSFTAMERAKADAKKNESPAPTPGG